jgi:hypothetical protein
VKSPRSRACPGLGCPTLNAGDLDTVSISVLRAYVEALGGELKVTAEFDDSSYLVA